MDRDGRLAQGCPAVRGCLPLCTLDVGASCLIFSIKLKTEGGRPLIRLNELFEVGSRRPCNQSPSEPWTVAINFKLHRLPILACRDIQESRANVLMSCNLRRGMAKNNEVFHIEGDSVHYQRLIIQIFNELFKSTRFLLCKYDLNAFEFVWKTT
jgi:hypothetical protein